MLAQKPRLCLWDSRGGHQELPLWPQFSWKEVSLRRWHPESKEEVEASLK